MASSNRMRELVGVEAPIVLGAFGGLSSPALTAQVSTLGGLGSYGLYGYTAKRIHETVVALRGLTPRPFALNLWLPTGDEIDPVDAEFDKDFETATSVAAALYEELAMSVPPLPAHFLPDFQEQFDAVIDARPAALSLVYGVPSPELVTRAHAADIRLIGTATTVDEAVALEAGGVDAVVATGAEAAGHRVSFLRPAEESLVGTFALVPQVVDAIDIPVIAAGGIADRRGVAAAFALGADGVQVGTAFLRTEQSAATPAHRAAIAATPAHGTVLTRAMSGRLSRGVPNHAVQYIEAHGAIARFPAQNWLTGQFRAEAVRQGVGELLSLWMGQAGPLSRSLDAEEVYRELLAGVPADD